MHEQAVFPDPLNVAPADSPLLIWADPVELPWTSDERSALLGSPETERWLGPLPAGMVSCVCHDDDFVSAA